MGPAEEAVHVAAEATGAGAAAEVADEEHTRVDTGVAAAGWETRVAAARE